MGDLIFRYDNAPIHCAKAIEAFLKHYHITAMWWLVTSLDLNPVEHLWYYMKIRFHEEFFNAYNIIHSRSENALNAYSAWP